MTADVTGSPSTLLPGQVTGAPIRIPYVLCCRQGERFCGQTWTANTRLQFAEHLAARRRHEQDCPAGLILP